MPDPARGLGGRLERLKRRPWVARLLGLQEHYGSVKAGQQAGAVTYFGFLSVFPLLALAFFVVGYVSQVLPGADATLARAIDELLPGLLGSGEGQLSLADVQQSARTVGIVGLVGVLYAGLGWVSALRDALQIVFATPEREQPGFVAGKLRDLGSLVVLGAVLLVAVAVSGLVAGFSDDVLGWAGLGAELGWLVKLLTVALGLAANAVLFFGMFRLLAEARLPRRALWSGALAGSLAFEVLKQVSGELLAVTRGQPAFQAFGIALILLVWMSYTSRVVLYAASWAWTSPAARAARVADPAEPVQGPRMPSVEEAERERPTRPTRVAAFAAGAITASGLLHLVRRRKETS